MLSVIGWINTIGYLFVFFFGSILGIFILYQSKKLKARLLSYMGLFIFFSGFTYLGKIIDIFSILITGNNMDNTYGLNGLLIWMWVPLLFICALYLGAELIVPKFKKLVLYIFLILAIIGEFVLFIDPFGILTFKYPDNPGENIIDNYMNLGTTASILALIFVVSFLIFDGFGFLFKTLQSKGVIRKKFLMLSIGMLLWISCQILEAFLDPTEMAILLIFGRLSNATSLWVLYLGIREEPEKPKKLPTEKEVKVEESLFRLTKRPARLTEEEVSISKEKKICLVCKGKLGGLMFMCTECGALYCIKCSEALSNLENACWACSAPIDKTKPSKLYKEEEEDITVEDEILKKGKKENL